MERQKEVTPVTEESGSGKTVRYWKGFHGVKKPTIKPAAKLLSPTFQTVVCCLLFVLGYTAGAFAQENAWTKSTNGFWEERVWSLGVLPNTGQDLVISNAGAKVITINSNTVQRYPQTLTVRSLSIAGPSNSFNHLYLNRAGLEKPLAAEFIAVGSNSALTIFSSALELTGGAGEGLSVAGQVHQNPGSRVTGQQVDVGALGAGVYNLNGGLLDVDHFWLGGPKGATFNHNGGTNKVGIVHLYGGAVYTLKSGLLGATLYFDDYSSVLYQRGGRIERNVTIQNGTFYLQNGICNGVTAPPGNGYSIYGGSGTVIQTGGTNLGSLWIGGPGSGTYVLSNGVSKAGSIALGAGGSFEQYNGTQIVSGVISMTGRSIARERWSWGTYSLYEGSLAAGGMEVEGHYWQRGGSNYVSGDINLHSRLAYGRNLTLSGGVLIENNLTAHRAVEQSGGLHIIKSNLTIYGGGPTETPYFGAHYVLSGGTLQASNILLRGAIMSIRPGALVNSGLIILGGGRWMPGGGGSDQFGGVKLETWNGWTNSAVILPTNTNCVVRFRASSQLAWVTNATLFINHWTGSISGKGLHQIYFGTNAAGLTQKQLKQVQFVDPLGLKGVFPALLLPTGELVPQVPLQVRRNGGQLLLEWSQSYQLQSAPEPSGPYQDVITAVSPFAVNFELPRQFFRLRETSGE